MIYGKSYYKRGNVANKILNLIFKADATDATAEMEKLKGEPGGEGGVGGTGVMGVTASLKSLIDPALLVAGALYGVGRVIGDQMETLRDYHIEVGNLALSLSLTTEETSFLMGQMELYGITNDTMVAVFRKLATEGIDPTIAGLKSLLIEYENMEEGVEKAQFKMEMFGEQGIKQIIPWWGRLTDAQKENFGVQEDGIIVTDDSIVAMQEQELAIKNLETVYQQFSSTLYASVAPALTNVLDLLLNIGDAQGFAQAGRDLFTTVFQREGLPSQQPLEVYKPGPTYKESNEGRRQYGADTGNAEMLSEVRRLVDSLPVAISDAVERR